MKLIRYSISTDKWPVRSPTVWGYGDVENYVAPILYIRRPKWIKDDGVWEQIVQSIRLDLPAGLEIT